MTILTGDGCPSPRPRRRRQSVPVSPGFWMLVFVVVQSFSLRSGASDSQAQDIVKKMCSAYEATSYQGMAVIKETGTREDLRPFAIQGALEVAFKAPNRYLLKSSGDGVPGTQIRISDGKETATFNSDSAANASVVSSSSHVALLSLFGIALDVQNSRLLGTTVVRGRQAYLIQTSLSVPALKSGNTPEERREREEFIKRLQPFEIAVDKQDFRLLRVVQTSQDSTVKSARTVKTMEFIQQSFNPTLSDTLFGTTAGKARHMSIHSQSENAHPATEDRRSVRSLGFGH